MSKRPSNRPGPKSNAAPRLREPHFDRFIAQRNRFASPRITLAVVREESGLVSIFEAFPWIGEALRLQEGSVCRLEFLQIDRGVRSVIPSLRRLGGG